MDKEYYVQYYVGIKKEENKLFYENKLFVHMPQGK